MSGAVRHPYERKRVIIDGVAYLRYHTVLYDRSAGSYYGGNSFHWNYIQYRRINHSNHVRVNLLHFIHNAEGVGAVKPQWFLECVEYGMEVWKAGRGLTVRNFRLNLQKQ